MSRFEAALALGWLPLHVFLLPLLLVRLFPQMDGVDLNFWIYAAGALVLGLWAVLPDPVPVAIDDVIAGLGSAASILAILVSVFKKKQ